MTEQKDVWHLLRDHSPPQVHWTRLENLVGTGMSDVNGCMHGSEAWVENKLVKGNQIIFQPMQPAWMLKRLACGGRVNVLARKGDTLLLYSGAQLRQLLRSCVTRGKTLVAQYDAASPNCVLQPPYDWPQLLAAIFGHKTPTIT